MNQLRVVIIDDDRNRREMIRSFLPDYISGVAVNPGESALDHLKPDAEGVLPDLVIINGDDPKSVGLYIYDWMINKSPDARTADIPVIVLTNDEYSDRSLEFLEIGDVAFYEGDIDESELFSLINTVIEEREFRPEPVEPVYLETKNIDRLIGHSVKAPGDVENQRAIVLDMDTKLDNLEAAIERGRKRVSEIRTLIDAAQTMKEDKYAERSRHKNKRPDPEKSGETIRKMSAFLDKARAKVTEHAPAADADDPVRRLKQKAMTNPEGAMGAQGTIRMEERPKSRENTDAGTIARKTVVVVDSDVKTRKLCTLFLTQKYNVVALDSGIRTVDYFIRHHADLLIINPILGGMNGQTTVLSVHMQPGCSTVPVMYIVGDDFIGERSMLMGEHTVGILGKPIKRDTLARAVEGFFDSII